MKNRAAVVFQFFILLFLVAKTVGACECPDADDTGGWEEQKTDAVEIKNQSNVDNMELRLPLASCKDGKIISRIKID